MKVLILLAVVCTALADQHTGHTHPDLHPCLRQCKEQVKSKLPHDSPLRFGGDKWKTAEGRRHLRLHEKEYINGNAPILRNADTVDWDRMCTIATEAERCIDACSGASSDDRNSAKMFLHTMKEGCVADFKSSVPCLSQVYERRSELCQAKCTPVAAKWKAFLHERDHHPHEHVLPPKDVLQSMCNFINCRVFCRKPDVIGQCQDKGFEQAKRLVASVSTSKKMIYKFQGGDMNNWPTECESNKIVDRSNF